MDTYFLIRHIEDFETKYLAQVVEFETDGLVVLYWFESKSIGIYPNLASVRAVHCEGSTFNQYLLGNRNNRNAVH